MITSAEDLAVQELATVVIRRDWELLDEIAPGLPLAADMTGPAVRLLRDVLVQVAAEWEEPGCELDLPYILGGWAGWAVAQMADGGPDLTEADVNAALAWLREGLGAGCWLPAESPRTALVVTVQLAAWAWGSADRWAAFLLSREAALHD